MDSESNTHFWILDLDPQWINVMQRDLPSLGTMSVVCVSESVHVSGCVAVMEEAVGDALVRS